MKNRNALVSLIFLISLIITNCFSQKTIINEEKSEEVARIKSEIKKYREEYIPLIRNYLISSPRGLTKSELDSLIIDVEPIFIINKDATKRTDLQIRADSLMEGDNYGLDFAYIYDFHIKPVLGKNTIYSAISNIECQKGIKSFSSNLYSNNGYKKYFVDINVSSDINSSYVIDCSEYSNKYINFDSNRIAYPRYSKKSYRFSIRLDSAVFYNYRFTYPGPSTQSSEMFKDECIVLYNDRLYSYTCLVRTFKTTDLDWIFENHPNDLFNCDIDVFFRRNITLKEYRKIIESRTK